MLRIILTSTITSNTLRMPSLLISPIELLKITISFTIISEYFEFEIVKESSVWTFQHSDPSFK